MDELTLKRAIKDAQDIVSINQTHGTYFEFNQVKFALSAALIHLSEENERYRRALKDITCDQPGPRHCGIGECEIARQALKGEG